MVGVPLELTVSLDSCRGPVSSGEVYFVDEPKCPDSFYIIGFRGTASAQCEANFEGSEWRMDERPFNIGQTSDDIITPYVGNNIGISRPRRVHEIMSETEGSAVIRDVRMGQRVRHVYETPSYGKPVNGPGLSGQREPAYQVSLKTRWRLSATFQYQRLITHVKCYDGAGQEIPCGCTSPVDGQPRDCNKCYNENFTAECTCGTSNCFSPSGPASTRVFTETPWFAGPTISYPFEVEGAIVQADPQMKNQCTVIPIPVQQVQTVLTSNP
jgi:hypothetical protein